MEEYQNRMRIRVELMNQLLDRVHSYQLSIMQAFPKWIVCFEAWRLQELVEESGTFLRL